MAKATWGRKETIIWPQSRPIYTYAAMVCGIILTGLFIYAQLRFLSSSLCWYYAPVYARTSILGSFSRAHRSRYRMLFLTGPGKKPSPAMNDDVVHGQTLEPGGRIIPLALSPDARQHGDDLLFLGSVRSYVDARLNDYLKAVIYGGKDLSAILKTDLARVKRIP